jgi:tetratricopeptide (TPR) repeat protein
VLAVALDRDELAQLVQEHCGLVDFVGETEAVRSVLDETVAHPDKLRKIMESDTDFAEWVTTRSFTGDAWKVVEVLRTWLTYELVRYRMVHTLSEGGELDAGKLEEAAKEFEKTAEIDRKLERWEGYLASLSSALKARVLAAKSWKELLEKAKSYWELWKEAEEHLVPTVGYLTETAVRLGEYLVYLAASGDKERAEELLKERRWSLDYFPEVSVVTRLMLRFFGVGEGARLEEVVEAFWPWLSPEFRPALLALVGRLQIDEVPDECA